jgi:hypothetical protein
MGKALRYALVVLAIWAWLEIQTQGTQGAFGGALAGWFTPVQSVRGEPSLPPQPITQQVRDRVNASLAQDQARTNRLAGAAH